MQGTEEPFVVLLLWVAFEALSPSVSHCVSYNQAARNEKAKLQTSLSLPSCCLRRQHRAAPAPFLVSFTMITTNATFKKSVPAQGKQKYVRYDEDCVENGGVIVDIGRDLAKKAKIDFLGLVGDPVLVHILGFCESKSLSRMSCCTKRLHRIVQSNLADFMAPLIAQAGKRGHGFLHSFFQDAATNPSFSNFQSLAFYESVVEGGYFQKKRVVKVKDLPKNRSKLPGSFLRVEKVLELMEKYPDVKTTWGQYNLVGQCLSNVDTQSPVGIGQAIFVHMIRDGVLPDPWIVNASMHIEINMYEGRAYRNAAWTEYCARVPANLHRLGAFDMITTWDAVPFHLKFLVADENKKLKW